MGALYLAEDPSLGRLVAIKLLREGLDSPDLRDRFAREARAVAKLTHPNVVTIFDFGDEAGQPFIAMEYVRGETLAAKVERRETYALTVKLRHLEALCAGLGHAHKAGLVHRDIKPANIMVTPEGVLKILDFGIVRLGESHITQSGMMVGTLNYMSPEQMSGQSVDHRSDIFAVGAVAYEFLSYRRAFPGGLDSGVLHKILAGTPPPLSEICEGLDPGVIAIVDRALQKDPAQRYQDLDAMQSDLALSRLRLEAPRDGLPQPPFQRSDHRAAGAAPTPRRGTDRELLAKRRAAEIDEQVSAARKASELGDYEAAIVACERVLILDPNEERALQLVDEAQAGQEERRGREWLDEARAQIDQGALTAAAELLERTASLTVTGYRSDIRAALDALRAEVADARMAAQRTREQEAALAEATQEQQRAAALAATQEHRSEADSIDVAPVDIATVDAAPDDRGAPLKAVAPVSGRDDTILIGAAPAPPPDEWPNDNTLPLGPPENRGPLPIAPPPAVVAAAEDGPPLVQTPRPDLGSPKAGASVEPAPGSEAASPELRTDDGVPSHDADDLNWIGTHGRRMAIAAVALVLMALGTWVAVHRTAAPPNVAKVEEPVGQPAQPRSGPEPTATTPSAGRAASAIIGTLVVDATPWGDVVSIVPAKGQPVTLQPPTTTPATFDLAPGDYRVTVAEPAEAGVRRRSHTAAVRVTAGQSTQLVVPLHAVNIDEYFRSAGWASAK